MTISDGYARMLHKGHLGERVRKLQAALNTVRKAKLAEDGDFGRKTETAVKEFQLDNGIDATGVFTRVTARRMLPPMFGVNVNDLLYSGDESGIYPGSGQRTQPLPVRGQAGMIAVFGDPFVPGWDAEYLSRVMLPAEIFNKKLGPFNPAVHIYARAAYERAVVLMIEGKLRFNSYEGTLNKRKKRGGTSLSTHSWAVASDFEASTNPMGAKPKMDPRIVAVWKAAGFLWGGDWRSPDGMHFQRVAGI